MSPAFSAAVRFTSKRTLFSLDNKLDHPAIARETRNIADRQHVGFIQSTAGSPLNRAASEEAMKRIRQSMASRELAIRRATSFRLSIVSPASVASSTAPNGSCPSTQIANESSLGHRVRPHDELAEVKKIDSLDVVFLGFGLLRTDRKGQTSISAKRPARDTRQRHRRTST